MRSLTPVAFLLTVRAAAQQPAANTSPAETITAAAAKDAQCLSCHAPVAEQLKEQVVHRALEMGCEACHIDHLDGGVKSKTAHFVNAASVSQLCESCHAQFKKRFEEAQVQHTALQLDDDSCIMCHRPHARREPSLLKARVINLCIACDTDKPETRSLCTIRQAPTAPSATIRSELRGTAFCLSCHGKQ